MILPRYYSTVTKEDGRATRPRGTAFLLSQVGAHAAQRFAERIAVLGVNPADVGLLRMIAALPGRSQRSLAEEMGVVASRVVVLIDALERKGLVERRRDEEEISAGLTPAQRAQLAELLGIIADHQGLAPGVHPGYRG
jgi:DNA-binding MarR family transcriptional regulator